MEPGIWSTAVHEAGHAVIARVLNCDCGPVSIQADSDSEGFSVIGHPHTTWDAWDRRGHFRNESSAFRAHAMSLMAGAEAEIVLIGSCAGGDGHDRREISDLLVWADAPGGDRRLLEERLRRATRAMVQRYRSEIERLAIALLKLKKIENDADIRAVAGLPDAPAEADVWA